MSKVELSHLLDMYQQHSQQCEWYQFLVQKSISTVGMYHQQIVELLKKEFGCSNELRRFRIELNDGDYILCYYPHNNGKIELFPLDLLEQTVADVEK